MGIVFDSRFIIGVVVGVAALKGWHYYQAKNSSS